MNLDHIRRVPTRIDLIRELPIESIGAEIGVLHGDFSAEILETGLVKYLWQIDPYREMGGDYELDPANVSQKQQNDRWLALQERFKQDPRALPIRMTSYEAFLHCKKNRKRFQWVFIDSNHTEFYPLADLMLWSELSEVLFVHDYTDRIEAKNMKFTVKESVDRFTAETRWKITAITEEEWPTARLERVL